MIYFCGRKYAWFPSYTTENAHSQNLQDFTQWGWERHFKISHSVSHSVLLHSEMLLQRLNISYHAMVHTQQCSIVFEETLLAKWKNTVSQYWTSFSLSMKPRRVIIFIFLQIRNSTSTHYNLSVQTVIIVGTLFGKMSKGSRFPIKDCLIYQF